MDNPRRRTLVWSVVAGVIWGIAAYALWRRSTPLWIGGGAFIVVVAFLGWAFFFAQFVLPVTGWAQRWRAFRHLMLYLFGQHGPALFVQDGQILPRQGERLRQGPGVVVLDSASAAVLRTRMRYTRVAGPGVVFTARGEFLRQEDVLDLRQIVGRAGPRMGEDPFAPRGDDEDEAAYAERMQRRHETEGLTRDGIPVVASLVTVFYLDRAPDGISPEHLGAGRFRTEFYGHRESAWRAIVHRPVEASDENDAAQRLPWSWLPPYLAAELWKSYIRRFTFEQLFDLQAGQETETQEGRSAPATAIQRIQQVMQERLTRSRYRDLDPLGLPEENRRVSAEYRLLQERGVRIQAVSIVRLAFPPEVEERLAGQWSNSWLQRAIAERELVEQQRTLRRHRAERDALALLIRLWLEDMDAEVVSAQLGLEGQPDPQNVEHLRRVLCALTRRTLRLFDNPSLHRALGLDEEGRLNALVHWLEHYGRREGK